MKKISRILISLFALVIFAQTANASEAIPVPQIEGEWWQVTGNPMDHKYATERQEPVDFAVWQAADGTWQLWSCIRSTTAGGKNGKTRLFYRWEGQDLTDIDWKPILRWAKHPAGFRRRTW
jgi:hypothetical protein